MPNNTPLALIETLVDARNRGDVETVVGCYEKSATIVPNPGKIQSGTAALREWLAAFAAFQPNFMVMDRQIIEGDRIALHYSAWRLNGVDSAGAAFELEGRTTDVIRQQPDGNWLIAIDNPWGTSLLKPQ